MFFPLFRYFRRGEIPFNSWITVPISGSLARFGSDVHTHVFVNTTPKHSTPSMSWSGFLLLLLKSASITPPRSTIHVDPCPTRTRAAWNRERSAKHTASGFRKSFTTHIITHIKRCYHQSKNTPPSSQRWIAALNVGVVLGGNSPILGMERNASRRRQDIRNPRGWMYLDREITPDTGKWHRIITICVRIISYNWRER